jgi:hypothetical protein
MARILSGRDFGVGFPTGGGVANNNFSTRLSASLLNQAMQNDRQDQLTLATNQRNDQIEAQKVQKSQKVSQEKIRLDKSLLGLSSIFNQKTDSVDEQKKQKSMYARFAAEQIENGENPNRFIEAMNTPNFDEFRMILQSQINDVTATSGRASEALKAMQPNSGGLASAKTEILPSGATIQALPNGVVVVKDPLGNIVTGQGRVDVINESRTLVSSGKDADASRTIDTARNVSKVNLREGRISELTKTYGNRRRDSQASSVGLREALKLVENATQGFTGSAKLQLSKIFPSIDASNEAALESSLKRLSLDQLQKFKGPTTDFEFRVTEDIAGKLGGSQSANIARIASLQRNNYFIREQAEQFQAHVSAGGDPETYDFNFGKVIKIGKKAISLRDLQDTAVFHNISIDEAIRRFKK